MNPAFRKILLFVILSTAASLRCYASVSFSENFDELTPQLGVTAVGPFHAINGTNVDIVGGGLYGELCHSPESGNCVDLDGTGGDPQGILQTVDAFTLEPGVNYYLSFQLIGSQRGLTTSTTVDFGPYSQTFVLASNDFKTGIVLNQLVTVDTETQAYLTFTSNTGGQIGSVLDHVSITETEIPEPGTLSLICTGFAAVVGAMKRGAWSAR